VGTKNLWVGVDFGLLQKNVGINRRGGVMQLLERKNFPAANFCALITLIFFDVIGV